VSFTARVTTAVAATVAAAILLLAGITYAIVRTELRSEVDRSLRQIATRVAELPLPAPEALRPPPDSSGRRFGDAPGYVQLVLTDGSVVRPPGAATPLPVSAATRAIAAGRRGESATDSTVSGVRLRVLTVRRDSGGAIQVARPLTGTDRVLRRLAYLLGGVSLVGIALAGLAGRAVARRATAPVRRLTRAAEHVAETQDLSERIDYRRSDELGRLASSFNRMLEALAGSRRAQRQLVADASHELRTPLTSLRANLELLASGARLPERDRDAMLADLTSEAEELTGLVGDLVELAHDGSAQTERSVVRVDDVVRSALMRVRRRAPGVRFEEQLEPIEALGDCDALERAIVNLLDNAVKWSPAGGVVEVTARGARITVRDHGPGISEADVPLVFDRFYRAPEARAMPGSGLGLAIVRQVAKAHGGTAFAQRASGGGAQLVMTILAIDRRSEKRAPAARGPAVLPTDS